MIPRDHLQEWAQVAPWPDPAQVEQDLIISRALCDLFNEPRLAGKLAFRGGTAIHKLVFPNALRYSEDIDLVQITPGPIGPIIDGVRSALEWLGPCGREGAAHSMHLTFRFVPEAGGPARRKVKVEINTREHENLLGLRDYEFRVRRAWYSGRTAVKSFAPEAVRNQAPGTAPTPEGARPVRSQRGTASSGLGTGRCYQVVRSLPRSRRLIDLPGGRGATVAGTIRAQPHRGHRGAPARGITFSEDEAVDAIGRVWFRAHLRETKARSLLLDPSMLIDLTQLIFSETIVFSKR